MSGEAGSGMSETAEGTLGEPVAREGVGLHSGEEVGVRLLPAEAGRGIREWISIEASTRPRWTPSSSRARSFGSRPRCSSRSRTLKSRNFPLTLRRATAT